MLRLLLVLEGKTGYHLFMKDCARLYPQAKLYASPGLAEKRKDLTFYGVLKNSPESEWQKDLDQTIFEGNRFLEEVVFFHGLSRTLILTDLCFNPKIAIGLQLPLPLCFAYFNNINKAKQQGPPMKSERFHGTNPRQSVRIVWDGGPRQASALLKIIGKISGIYNQFRPAPWRRFALKDKRAAQESLKKILDWDFERILIAHGQGVETNGKAILREAYRWLF